METWMGNGYLSPATSLCPFIYSCFYFLILPSHRSRCYSGERDHLMLKMKSSLLLLHVICALLLHINARILPPAPVGAVKLRIGTRGSPLALAQAHETKNLLRNTFPELQHEDSIEIMRINTQGDSVLNQQLHSIGGKGLFTKELDVALLNNEVDICVHSMKDVPTTLAPGTALPCTLARQPTNDVFISSKYRSLAEVPGGAVLGTSSLRRKAQLLAMNPALKVVMFRGNVQTRLRKIDSGVVDGTLLALAGLRRLGMHDLAERSQLVPPSAMLPAVAQGAVGLQCREGDARALRYLQALNHGDTKACVDCERAFLRALDGNCRTPIAGQASIAGGELSFTGMLARADGSESVFVQRSGPAGEPEALGRAAALEVREHLGEDKFKEFQATFDEPISISAQ